MLDRAQILDETEAEALCGLADMLSNHFGAQPQAMTMTPSRDDVLRLVPELPEERVEAAWHALLALL